MEKALEDTNGLIRIVEFAILGLLGILNLRSRLERSEQLNLLNQELTNLRKEMVGGQERLKKEFFDQYEVLRRQCVPTGIAAERQKLIEFKLSSLQQQIEQVGNRRILEKNS